MKRSFKNSRAGAVALLAVAAAACGGSSDNTASGDTSGAPSGNEFYKAGVILPLTGPAAAIGADFNIALEVFGDIDPTVEDLDIEYVVCDSKTSPDGASACARKLIQQDDVNMIYGPVIAGAHAGAKPVLLTGPPSISPSPSAEAGAGEPIFSASGNSVDLDTTTLQFAADRGYRRVAVLATTDTTGETSVANLEQANEELGLELAVERMGPTDVDATAQLNRLLESDPEYVYLAASGAAAGVGLKGLKQLGADLPTALLWSNTTNAFFEAAAPVLPTETLYAMPLSWLPDELADEERAEQVRAFQAAFEERAGAPVSFIVQGGYDAFQLIGQSLAEAGGEKEDIMDYLENLDEFQGLNWTLSYSEKVHIGPLSGNYTMLQYDDGEWSTANAG